uniref:Monocarboxylate transporter 12 n=1 Tax=Schistocephalus solidus TaxID=70667 RepID=A0A0X3QAP4_SCHSO
MSTVEVDGSRAWVTVAGCFISNFILGGLAKSYGIIMEAFQEEFDAPSVYFTLTGGILYMIMFVLSLPNHLIVERIGDRAVVMVGGVCSCLSLLMAAAAPSVTIWAVAIGGGLGFSFACVYFNIFAVVGRCFRKKLGLANGISVAGVSVGQMAFPSFVTFLLEHYGVRSGTLVMAGFCLNICITAALMPRTVIDPSESEESSSALNVGCEDSEERQKDMSIVDGELECLKPSGDDILISSSSRNSSVSVTSLYHRSRLPNFLLAVYIVGKVFADNGDIGISFIAPPYATQMGFTSKTTSLAIAVAGVVDLLSRLIFGWLTDLPMFVGKRGTFLAVTWLVEGFNAIAFGELASVSWAVDSVHVSQPLWGPKPSTSLYVGFFLCFAVHGVCSGTAMTQMMVVLSDWVGPSRLPKSLAIMMVTLGLVYVPAQAVIGYLNDVSGTYAWSMRLCALWLLIATMIFLLEFPLRRWHADRSRSLRSTPSGRRTRQGSGSTAVKASLSQSGYQFTASVERSSLTASSATADSPGFFSRSQPLAPA